jgi:hypothetical protein
VEEVEAGGEEQLHAASGVGNSLTGAPDVQGAQAKYRAAGAAWVPYRAIHLTGRGPTLTASLTRKERALQALLARYAEVGRFRVPRWSVAALYQTGEAYLAFYTDLRAVPLPPEIERLGRDASATYRDLLESQADTFRDKAREAFQRAADFARDNRLRTPESERAERRLAELATSRL